VTRANLAPNVCDEANTIDEPQLSEADPGPINQEVTRSQLPGAHSDSEGQEPPEPEPMDVDAPDPPGRVWTIQRHVYYTSEVLHEADEIPGGA
jgi:hypothetical protein